MSSFYVKKSNSVVAYQPVVAKVILKTEVEKVFITKSVQGPPGPPGTSVEAQISADPGNQLTQGSDSKLFVFAPQLATAQW